MNPTMADEEQAYNAGLMEGIRLIGEVVERQPEAEALIHYTFEARKQAMRRWPIFPRTSGCGCIWPTPI